MKIISVSIYVLALVDTAVGFSSRLAHYFPSDVGVRSEHRWRVKYVNFEYGFSVIIPKGRVRTSPPTPWPQHGVKIQLTKDGDSFLLANADFSASDYSSLREVVDSDIKEAETSRSNLMVLGRRSERLGSLRAMLVILKYRDSKSGLTIVEVRVIGIRRHRNPEESVLYTLRLLTRQDRYHHDRRIFDQVLKSWRTRPMPK